MDAKRDVIKDKIQKLIESIDLKPCVFCNEVLLMKGNILGIKGLIDVNHVTKKVASDKADLVIPVVCPKCGFVHLFDGGRSEVRAE